jgi:hypothetical protein
LAGRLSRTRVTGDSVGYESESGTVFRVIGRLTAIVLDCREAAPLARFWAEVLGWAVRPYDEAEVARLASLGYTPETDPSVAVDAPDGSLTLFCQKVPEPRTVKNRMHLDLRPASSVEWDRLLALGATVREEHPEWTTMADPEGNEFCVFRQATA